MAVQPAARRQPSAAAIRAHPRSAHARRRPSRPVCAPPIPPCAAPAAMTVTTRIAHRRGARPPTRPRANGDHGHAAGSSRSLGAVRRPALGAVGLRRHRRRPRPSASCPPGLPDPSELGQARLRPADDRLRPRRQGGARSVRGPAPARPRLRRDPDDDPRRDDHRRGSDVLGQRRHRRPRTRSRRSPRTPPATSDRGASTITQQLVRARLLPEDVVQAGADRYLRKVKEIIQALRVNETYPGRGGQGARDHRVPERDLLRPRGVRHRRRGRDLLRGHGPRRS